MSGAAWDIGGSQRRYEIGSRHWVVEWQEHRHKCDSDCENRDLTECFAGHGRAFPTRALALAFARKCPGVGGPRIAEEVFEPAGHDGGALGSWERVGEYEEVG